MCHVEVLVLGAAGGSTTSERPTVTLASAGSRTLWAATSPLLEGMGGVYCEDCNIAALSGEQPVRYRDVEPHAVDQDSAERLWEMSETLLAQA